jgi:hypothetical protein
MSPQDGGCVGRIARNPGAAGPQLQDALFARRRSETADDAALRSDAALPRQHQQYRVRLPHHPNDDEPSYREAITIVLAVAAGCALLLLGAMWLIELR